MAPSKHSSRRWGEWSEWAWNENYSRWYRMRMSDRGEVETEWDEQDVPRTTDNDVDQMAESFAHAQLSPNVDTINVANEYTTDPKSKGKGKSKSGDSKSREADYAAEQAYQTYGQQAYAQAEYDRGLNYQPDPAAAASYSPYYGHDYQHGEPSVSAYPAMTSSANAYGWTTNQYGEVANDITGAEAANQQQSDYLDDRYSVQHSSKFRAGEIFKVFWSEPKGKRIPSLSGHEERVSQLGELIHTGFRRFIVIANDQGHCTCVPILTYESKACTKRGVKPDKHGIIYDERKKPRTLSDEPSLGFKPVRAQMTEPIETLAKESRVNYSKPSTVEHNALVLFIGRVHPDDWSTVKKAYSKCWEKKNHHHRR